MKNRVVLVTGGGRGIGRAICRRFAAEGAQIVAASRTHADLRDTRTMIEESGGKCHSHPTDLNSPEEINGLINDTVADFGGVHVLVNNAGVAPKMSLQELDPRQFAQCQAININAVYHMCRSCWPIMVKQGGGVIVNISSLASVDPFPGFTAYGAAKAWVNAWTKGLAEEGRSVGIQVFCVAPGAVETGMLREAFPDFPQAQALEPMDVANFVHALAQRECQHASGSTVFVKK